MTYAHIGIKAAKAAGDELAKMFVRPKKYSKKSSYDLLAEADLRAETIIISTIQKAFPDHSIFSEEAGKDKNKSPFQWIVDPLDGTINFVSGIEEYAVSIALSYRKKPILGIIYQPYGKRLYVGEKGRGAFLNGKKMHVSVTPNIIDAVLASDNTKNVSTRQENYDLIAQLCSRVRHIRIMGCSALHLARLASGTIDAYIKTTFNYWDIAAGVVLIQEAGGRVSDLAGKPLQEGSRGIIASNGSLHSQCIRLVE
ncbi:MAG: inositol monophosphatase family protein [Candidatus Uhrbacteria bacterium]|nr:inositol monophosphatase family protein [Candidatus Uhrbacteria bacterium]